MGRLWFLLRALNLLEPGRRIVSISKSFMWATVFALVWVTVTSPENVSAILASSIASTVATANYGYRRWVQHRDGITKTPLDNPERL